MSRFHELAFTPAVTAVQAQQGSRRSYARLDGKRGEATDPLGPDERAFIERRDSFFVASVSETGWPYVQHRGGPVGFLTVLDEHTLAFADYRGNRQYLTVGNTSKDDRVALLLMDYPNQARLKLLGHLRVSDDPALKARLTPTDRKVVVERVFTITVEGFDWNCPQHITPRYTEAEVAEAVAPLRERLAWLEAENARLVSRRSTDL
jgi:uncharacterized protein